MRAILAAMVVALIAADLMAHKAWADSANTPAPPASTMMPPSINTLDGAVGTSKEYARADHQHPTSVQRFSTVTGSDGTVKWTFKKAFADTAYATWGAPGASGITCFWSSKTPTSVLWSCRTGLLTALVPAASVPIDLAAGTATQ